jgi:cell division protein FtsB
MQIEDNKDADIVTLLKYKELLRKNLAIVVENSKYIKKQDTEISDLRAELRAIKKENKTLKKAVIHDNSSDDDEDLYVKVIIRKIHGKCILINYERIKSYLLYHKIRLTRLANKYYQGNFDSVVKARSDFISLKMARINLAHPEFTPIKNDNEFFKILDMI